MLLMMICQLVGTLFTVWIFQKFISKERFISIGLDFINYKNDFYQGLAVGAGLISVGFFTLIILNLISIDLTYSRHHRQRERNSNSIAYHGTLGKTLR